MRTFLEQCGHEEQPIKILKRVDIQKNLFTKRKIKEHFKEESIRKNQKQLNRAEHCGHEKDLKTGGQLINKLYL